MDRIDDKTVLGDAVIWRRVPHWNVTHDPKAGGCRPSTAVFEDDYDDDPMSACLSGQQTPLATLLVGHEDYAVVAFRMEVARGKELGVVKDPLPGEPDHVKIFGKKTKSAKKALVAGSHWVIPLPLRLCKAPGGVCTCVQR